MKVQFPCIACGLCCQNARKVPELQPLIREDGQCRYWDKASKKCLIYSKRPAICNIGMMYDKVFCKQMNEEEYILSNLKVCYALNQNAGNCKNMREIARLMKQVAEKFSDDK